MLNRGNLLIVGVAILGAILGLVVSSHMDSFGERSLPPGVDMLRLGDQRVDLDLIDVNGTPRHLGEWDGKLLLVNFWASWCGPCREEMPLLDQTHTKLADRGLQVVGVAIDNIDAVRDFLKDRPVRYPIVLSNENEDASVRFGDIRGVLPYSVLIRRDGKIVAQREGNFSEASLARWLEPYL